MAFTCPIHGYYEPVPGSTIALCPACSAPKDLTPMQGWECPRCRSVHSPYTRSCHCQPPTVTSAGTQR